jgi:hypothetical protein
MHPDSTQRRAECRRASCGIRHTHRSLALGALPQPSHAILYRVES